VEKIGDVVEKKGYPMKARVAATGVRAGATK
jgi:hypothetical protein